MANEGEVKGIHMNRSSCILTYKFALAMRACSTEFTIHVMTSSVIIVHRDSSKLFCSPSNKTYLRKNYSWSFCGTTHASPFYWTYFSKFIAEGDKRKQEIISTSSKCSDVTLVKPDCACSEVGCFFISNADYKRALYTIFDCWKSTEPYSRSEVSKQIEVYTQSG